MFKEKELNEFVNRMFDNAIRYQNSNIKDSLNTFRNFLSDTKMCSQEYLKKLDKIIACSDELIALKSKLVDIDISSLVKIEEQSNINTPKISTPKVKTYPSYEPSSNNHRSHYVYQSSGSCGGSSSSYSSSCGGSVSTYRGC